VWKQSGPVNLVSDQWQNIVVVKDSRNCYIYVNGTEIIRNTGCSSDIVPATAINFRLAQGYSSGARYWNGLIDEVRIYNRALSPEEVRALYAFNPNPVAYFTFDEGSGNTVFDKSGNSKNGTWYGTLGNQWTIGKYGKGGYFDGSTNYIDSTNSLINTTTGGDNTVSFWMNWNGTNLRMPFGFAGYDLILWDGNFGFNTGCSDNWGYTATGLTNQWVYVTAIFNNGDYTRNKLYINGIEKTLSQKIGTSCNKNASTNFHIGEWAGGYNKWGGKIDDFKIYNYAISPKQIISDMNAGHPAVGSPVGSAIGYWKFDEGYGTIVNNSGNGGIGLSGILGSGNSAPTWTNNGKFGKALSFDGNNDYVDCGVISLGSRDFSFAAWIFPIDWATKEDDGCIYNGLGEFFHRGSWAGRKMYFMVRIVENANRGDSAWGYWAAVRSLTDFQDNTFYHLVGIKNGNNLAIYVNGVKERELNCLAGYTVDYGYLTNLWIGKGPWGNAKGLIDEVKIYNYALTEDEVKLDYNRGASSNIGVLSKNTGSTAPDTAQSQAYCIPGDTSPCNPPIVEYNFEEGTGTSGFDSSGNNNSCLMENSPAWSNGKIGKAIVFNGSNQRCSKASGIGTSFITIESWIYRTSTGNNQGIVRQQGVFALSLYDNTIQVAPGNNWTFYNTGITIPTNSWNHVAWTYDGSLMKVFWNGQIGWSGALAGSFPTNSNTLYTGYDNNGWYWGGKIDGVKIFNYARTPAQVAWDYNRGAPIGWWKFDECQGNIAHDASGVGNTGTIVIGAGGSQVQLGTCGAGDTSAWSNGKTGKLNSAMSFDGTDDWINVGNVGTTMTSTTISAWIKISGSTGTWQVPLTLGSSPTINIACESGDNQQCGCDLYNAVTNPINIGYNNWTLITCVKTPSGMTQYINGAYSAYEANSSSITNPMVSIGRGRASEYYTKGLIDDVRIYNYALTGEQIKQIYNDGAVKFN